MDRAIGVRIRVPATPSEMALLLSLEVNLPVDEEDLGQLVEFQELTQVPCCVRGYEEEVVEGGG